MNELDPFDRSSYMASTEQDAEKAHAETVENCYQQGVYLLAFLDGLQDGAPEVATRLTKEEALDLAAAVWRPQ